MRTKCCAAWACHDCLAGKAQESEATCPQCATALKPEDVPQPWAQIGFGFSGESGAAQAAQAAAVDVDPCGAVEMQSKLRVVLSELAKVRDEGEKARTLIFSQHTHSLNWLANELVNNGYTHATIAGNMTLQQRAAALKAFQTAEPTTTFLLNLRVAAVGLNLTAASHVILLEPCMNPALEEQAIGRVYRMGQTRRRWSSPGHRLVSAWSSPTRWSPASGRWWPARWLRAWATASPSPQAAASRPRR